jgi:hypothetical protein
MQNIWRKISVGRAGPDVASSGVCEDIAERDVVSEVKGVGARVERMGIVERVGGCQMGRSKY